MRVEMVERDARLDGERADIILGLSADDICIKRKPITLVNRYVREEIQHGARYLRWGFRGGAESG